MSRFANISSAVSDHDRAEHALHDGPARPARARARARAGRRARSPSSTAAEPAAYATPTATSSPVVPRDALTEITAARIGPAHGA